MALTGKAAEGLSKRARSQATAAQNWLWFSQDARDRIWAMSLHPNVLMLVFLSLFSLHDTIPYSTTQTSEVLSHREKAGMARGSWKRSKVRGA